jgi:pimeloyl-ACP methyl ester carboxylesterase
MKTVTSKDGTTIAYDQVGAGPALILVGGATQHRAIDPRTSQLADLLAEHFTVVHYDRRGRGDSTDNAPYAPKREIEDIEALIDAVGGSAMVFGMSSGAVLALDAAHQLSGKITKLALYEPPLVVEDSRPAVPADYVQQLNDHLAAGRRDAAIELFMTVIAGVPAEYLGPMKSDPFWSTVDAIAPTLAYDGAIMDGLMLGRPLPADRWTAVTAPTLVIDGGASQPYMRHGADALAQTLAGTRRRTLAGQDHGVAPEVLAPVLREFYV